MKCPKCGNTESKVTDTRSTDDYKAIRRRRECLSCGRRFTTYEVIETTPILVVKNDGTRQAFDINKLKNGIIKSCEKRPVSMSEIDGIIDAIEKQLSNEMCQEVTSKELGEIVMSKLKNIDEVAYVRFASVYRRFKDLSTFMEEIKKLTNE